MARLKLRKPIDSSDASPTDASRLRFPEGGVFGSNNSPRPRRRVTSTDDIIAGVDHTLRHMQEQLDELKHDAEQVLHLPRSNSDPDWTPPHRAA